MGLLSGALKIVDKVTGGFLGDLSGKSQQKDANKMAMQSWNLANDYNHPIQQIERLKAAGLNPLLVYGSGSVTGNTTGAPSLVGGGISTPVESAFKGVNNIMSVLQGNANLQNTRAQTQASVASAGASGAQAANLNAQTAINEKKADYEEKNLIADLDYKKALTAKIKNDNRQSSANADMLEGEAKLFSGLGGSKGASAVGRAAGNVLTAIKGLTR